MSGSATCDRCGQPIDWITASRAASVLGVTEGRVRKLLADGRLPGATKSPDSAGGKPGSWQVPLTSLAALIDSRQNDPTATRPKV